MNQRPPGLPDNLWILSSRTAPWTISWMTCTVRGYTKLPLRAIYLMTTCPDFSLVVWWCPEVPLQLLALLCDSLCASAVKQSPCPEDSKLWRGKSVMMKHVKPDHRPASLHLPLLILPRQPQKNSHYSPAQFRCGTRWLVWIMMFSISSGYSITNTPSDTFIMIISTLCCAVLKILSDNNVVLILFFKPPAFSHQTETFPVEPELEKG